MLDLDLAETLAPVRKVMAVPQPVARVFELYTRQIGQWWPLATHSLAEDKAESCSIEGWVGGRVFERDLAGGERRWGEVTAWEPPNRVACSWHPGGVLSHATRVEVLFQPIDAGLTRLVLIHDGWRPGDADRHPDYEDGWETILKEHFLPFVARAG
jgi:uncharacterized protein YndB with AHSA1/START domain